jgi:hypothetical protein
MQSFLQKYASKIKGVLSGLDRIRFRGTLRLISSLRGMSSFMSGQHLLLKDFQETMRGCTVRMRDAGKKLAEEAGRPHEYLQSSSIRKEQMALEIAQRDNVQEGLVCVLTCVEPCVSFRVSRNAELKKLELHCHSMKCLHQYFYLIDPQMGLMHLRLQTWAPYTAHVCLNGREWLARQLQAEGISFEQRDNCFVDVGDIERAQALLDEQVKTNWSGMLNGLLERFHPMKDNLLANLPMYYYWSTEEMEWATDVMFKREEDLARLYPRLLQQAMLTFGGNDVLRFLGQRGRASQCRTAEITTSLGKRHEGIRIKHSRNRNSIKMYDKQGSVLRIETTTNNPRDLKALRTTEGGPPDEKPTWQKMRKGVADMSQRCEVSQACNERYLEGLAQLETPATVGETLGPLTSSTRWKGRSVRGLNVLSEEDSGLLSAIGQAEFLLTGFRNRDLRALLFKDEPSSPEEAKRRANKVTRLIRMLRAHKLIRKVSKSTRYQITPHGQQVITALKATQNTAVEALTQLAA